MQSNLVRIVKGAPDFETLADSLEWDGPAPKQSGKDTVYQPVRSAPGWSAFRRGFFMRADATICVPKDYDALQIETFHKGHVRVLLADRSMLDDVRLPLVAFALAESRCSVLASH